MLQKDLTLCYEDCASTSQLFVHPVAPAILCCLPSFTCSGSPLSAAVTMSYFQRSRAAGWGPLQALELDYVLCGHFMSAESDFYEGVRAKLIDKDDKPRWKHSSIDEVSRGVLFQWKGVRVAGLQLPCVWDACLTSSLDARARQGQQ